VIPRRAMTLTYFKLHTRCDQKAGDHGYFFLPCIDILLSEYDPSRHFRRAEATSWVFYKLNGVVATLAVLDFGGDKRM